LINVMVLIYQALSFLRIPFALGFSIIVLTIVIRLALYPLMSSQLKSQKKMMGLNPHLKKLKEKHKGDAKMLQAETMRLYKEHGVNPVAGCLPLLLQMPLIFALYQVLQDVVKYNIVQINKVLYSDAIRLSKPWDLTFFGLPLAQNPSHLISTVGPLILLVPILTGGFQFIQSKMMMPVVSKDEKKLSVAKSASGGKKDDDFSTAMQSQMTYLLPFMIAFFSWNFPIGLSLYWNTFTIFGIIQQYKVAGLGGLEEWAGKIYGSKK
jgi:YidC/Oxa1 family membrane protein insertase